MCSLSPAPCSPASRRAVAGSENSHPVTPARKSPFGTSPDRALATSAPELGVLIAEMIGEVADGAQPVAEDREVGPVGELVRYDVHPDAISMSGIAPRRRRRAPA